MVGIALKTLGFLLLLLPWIAVPLSGWFGLKGRWSFAVILALHLTLGAWMVFFGVEFLASHGKLTGGSSGAIAGALRQAMIAFALSLVVTGGMTVWRRRQV